MKNNFEVGSNKSQKLGKRTMWWEEEDFGIFSFRIWISGTKFEFPVVNTDLHYEWFQSLFYAFRLNVQLVGIPIEDALSRGHFGLAVCPIHHSVGVNSFHFD